MFDKYLQQYSKNTESEQTHLSFKNGKYNIPNTKLDDFYKTYYKAYKNNVELYIIEKITNRKFAFFYDIDSEMNDTDVMNLIEKTNYLINIHFEGDKLTEYVVSKRRGINKYHINYPNLIVNSQIAKAFTNLLIQNNMKIDQSVYRTGLRILGSCKKTLDDIYTPYNLLTGEYYEINEYSEFEKFLIMRMKKVKLSKCNLKINKIESAIKIKGVENTKITKELENLINDYIQTEPLYENINFNINRVISTQNKTGLFCYYISIKERYCPFKSREHQRESDPLYLEISNNGIFLKCYDEDCLKRRYPENGILLPDNFEQAYPETFKSMTTKYWNTGINISNEIRKELETSLKGTHYLIAKAAFNIYKDRFRVDDIKNTNWYEFDGIRWKSNYKINLLISEELPKYYQSIKISDTSHLENANMLEEFLVHREQIDKNLRNNIVDNIIKNLETNRYKMDILTQLSYLFKEHDSNFYKLLDTKTHLIGFANGVYDFNIGNFRVGHQDDYLTYSTGYDYIDYEMVKNTQIVKDIFDFLSKIIRDEQVLIYLLKILGKSLVGRPDERFYIWTGLDGANGKSTLINFLELTLGDYTTSVDVSLLTNKRGLSSNASPDVMRLKGKRLLTFQEPEGDDKLRTGILKQFSGGDTIIARELFKSPITFKLQGTMIMCCNQLPSVTSIDGGSWRRIRVIEFNSKFCDIPKKENEFKIDPLLKIKLQQWKPYFMSILLHYYKLYLEEGLEEPDQVKVATDNYKVENDKFNEFFDTQITEDDSHFTTTRDLYQYMLNWWSLNTAGVKMPDLKEFKTGLKMKYGNEVRESSKNGYHLKFID